MSRTIFQGIMNRGISNEKRRKNIGLSKIEKIDAIEGILALFYAKIYVNEKGQ